jgi:hypothetical protein
VGVDPEPPHPAIPSIRMRSRTAVDRIFISPSFTPLGAALLLTLTEIAPVRCLRETARLALQEILARARAVYEWRLTSI